MPEMRIYDKLFSIQQELAVPKGRQNDFGGFKYRSAADILAAVKPLLSKHSCVITLTDDLINIGDRYYVKADATLTDLETLTHVSATAYAREDPAKKGMDGSQITGSASSYARKYALAGLFAIDDEKDADTRSGEQNQTICRCHDCGEEIQGYTSKTGAAVSASDWAAKSRKIYGVQLCVECAKTREMAREATENDG